MFVTLFCIVVLVASYFIGVHIAWLVNRRELKRIYGVAPYHWRMYGYIFTYIPYLQKLKRERQV